MSLFNSPPSPPRVPRVPRGLILLCLLWYGGVARAEGKPEVKSRSVSYVVVGKPITITFYGENLTPKEVKANKPGVTVKLGAMKATEGDDKKKGSQQVSVEVTTTPTCPPENVELTFVQPDGGKATMQIPLVEGATTEIKEKKPNGTFAQAMQLTLMPDSSLAVIGNVENDTPATFKFEAKAGEIWRFRVFAGRGDSTLDPVARVRDSRHLSLALAVGDAKKDRVIVFTVPTTGTYYMEIMDEQSRGGGGFSYRLTAQQEKKAAKP